MNKLAFTTLLITFALSPQANADNWQPMTGADNLQQLVSGGTAEIELKHGVTAVGKYHADGTAEIEAWNETFRRTWEVKGDDQVCYSDVETNCFSFEKNLDDPAEFRARNVATGEVIVFRVTDTETDTFTRETPAGSEGGLGTPSAAEVAAALSDPNTNMGSMNFQFDYISYDGNIPGASSTNATRMLFQPSLPYKLTDTTNLFIRPAIPVVFRQDVPQQDGGFSSEGVDLGDIGFDASLGTSLPGGIVLLGGLAGTIPTATNNSLGLDQ